ncbi:hypothetical protein AX15_006990 [Amanita polypyramis BW_CC]|nr:hypothetical protein AX15_006990 [Amanita polypyramis BW_CC]
MEHDSAVSATLAAAGLYRTPLDDDDDAPKTSSHPPSGDVEMNQRASSRLDMATVHSQPSNGRMSTYFDAPEAEGESFNPYTEFGAAVKGGYIPARGSSPDEYYRDRHGSTSTTGFIMGHSASGSYEPLLASYYRQSVGSPPSPTVPLAPLAGTANQSKEEPAAADVPHDSARSSSYNSEDTDNRLDPNIRKRLESVGDNGSVKELRDEEDYSRPVLSVRNLPDASSRES